MVISVNQSVEKSAAFSTSVPPLSSENDRQAVAFAEDHRITAPFDLSAMGDDDKLRLVFHGVGRRAREGQTVADVTVRCVQPAKVARPARAMFLRSSRRVFRMEFSLTASLESYLCCERPGFLVHRGITFRHALYCG